MPFLPEGPLHIDLAVGAAIGATVVVAAVQRLRFGDPSLGCAVAVAAVMAYADHHYWPLVATTLCGALVPLVRVELALRSAAVLVGTAGTAAIAYAIVPDTEWAVATGAGAVAALVFRSKRRASLPGTCAVIVVIVAMVGYGTVGRPARVWTVAGPLAVWTFAWALASRYALHRRRGGNIDGNDRAGTHYRTVADSHAG